MSVRSADPRLLHLVVRPIRQAQPSAYQSPDPPRCSKTASRPPTSAVHAGLGANQWHNPTVFVDPAVVYEERLAAHRSAHARLERLDARFAHARLGVFALTIMTGLVAWRAAVTRGFCSHPGTRFRDEHHPYAADLDLFGAGSVFEFERVLRVASGKARELDTLSC